MTTTKLLQDMVENGAFSFSYACKGCKAQGGGGIIPMDDARHNVAYFAKLAEEQYKYHNQEFECDTEGCNSSSAWFAILGEDEWR